MPAQMLAFYDELVNISCAGDQQKLRIGHFSTRGLNSGDRMRRVSLLLRDEGRARNGRVRAFKKACCCLRQTALSGFAGSGEQASSALRTSAVVSYMPGGAFPCDRKG